MFFFSRRTCYSVIASMPASWVSLERVEQILCGTCGAVEAAKPFEFYMRCAWRRCATSLLVRATRRVSRTIAAHHDSCSQQGV